jgi:hypothetical protein
VGNKGLLIFDKPDPFKAVRVNVTNKGKEYTGGKTGYDVKLKFADAKVYKIIEIKEHPTKPEPDVVTFTYQLSNIAEWALEMSGEECDFNLCGIIKGNKSLAQSIEVRFVRDKYMANPLFALKAN